MQRFPSLPSGLTQLPPTPGVEADDGRAVLVHGVEERVDDVAHRATVPQQLLEPVIQPVEEGSVTEIDQGNALVRPPSEDEAKNQHPCNLDCAHLCTADQSPVTNSWIGDFLASILRRRQQW